MESGDDAGADEGQPVIPDLVPVIDPLPIDDPVLDMITGVDAVPSF